MSEYKIITNDDDEIESIFCNGNKVIDYSTVQKLSESTHAYYKDMRYGDDRYNKLAQEAFWKFDRVYDMEYKKNKRYPTIRGVYFASFGNINGAIKIGHSIHIWNRLKGLRYSHDIPNKLAPRRRFGTPYLHACVVIPDGKDIQAYEKAFHKYFSSHHIGLEFFKKDPVLNIIQSNI